MESRQKNAAWPLSISSTVQNGSNEIEDLGFFEDEFHKENLQLRD